MKPETPQDFAAYAVDDARLFLTRGYAANDPEMREVINIAIAAAEPHLRRQHRRELLDELIAEAEKQEDESLKSWRDIPKGHVSDVLSCWYMEGTLEDSYVPISDWLKHRKESEE